LSGLSIGAVGDRVVVKDGAAQRQADSGQYLLAFGGDPESGSLCVIQLTDIEPTPDAKDWFKRGAALEGKNPGAALLAYERAIAADPAGLDARINLGRLLHESGELSKAERAYQDTLRACGAHPLLLYNLGVLLDDMERKEDAIEAYRAALREDPTLADCHYNLALLCEQLKKHQDAIRHMAQYRRLAARVTE
jgi:tetratricopeptide (TPR) repeat protein